NRLNVPAPKQNHKPSSYDFLPAPVSRKADVLYFAGCMTHLTPSIKRAMVKILDASGLNWSFIDEDGGVCCGRPLMLAGNDREARELINFNSQLIWKSGAHTLVTSCPICYKVFRESYYLDVEVLHHSQFIKKIIDEGLVNMNFLQKRVTYHTPCELGRRSGVYEEPKEVIRHVATLEPTGYDDENSLCCGGSLGNIMLSQEKRHGIAADVTAKLTANDPDSLITACPLCKKTLAQATSSRVMDIAELVAGAIADVPALKKNPSRHKKKVVKVSAASL
ncbi:MAG: (Fe-S)-binding protein, partial [Bacteroidales bacterium]|nr:(Fe-S)-binding protein [Bacteroidales bacterium]